MRIGKIASDAEYRMDEPFQNLWIFVIFIVLQTGKNLKFFNLSIWKIQQISNYRITHQILTPTQKILFHENFLHEERKVFLFKLAQKTITIVSPNN